MEIKLSNKFPSAILLPLLTVLLSAPAMTQQLPVQAFGNLRAQMPADTSQWSKDDYVRYTAALGKLLVDIVWDTEKLTTPKPEVTAVNAGRRDPPGIAGNTIGLEVLYTQITTQIGFTLGRDIAANQVHPIAVDKPLLQRPFAIGTLVQSMDPAILYFQTAYFASNQQLIACPSTDSACSEGEALAAVAVQLYQVAHECGHYVHGDPAESQDPQKEQAADKFAWDVLTKIAAAYHTPQGDTDDFYDELFEAAPLAVLNFEYSSKALANKFTSPPIDTSLLKARIDALYQLSGDDQGEIWELLPKELDSQAYRSVTITGAPFPDFVLVNGIRMASSELAGVALRNMNTRVAVFAYADNGIFCAVNDSSDDLAVHVQLQPFIGAPDAAALAAAVKANDFETILRMTVDSSLTPRDVTNIKVIDKALSGCGAGALVNPDWSTNNADKNRARMALKRAAPLYGWGIN